MRARFDIYLLVALLFGVFVLQQTLNEGVTSDGCLYFAHLRSLVFDGDLQIDPELQLLHLTDRSQHVVPIGPAIVWAPLYLLVTSVDWAAGVAGVWTRASGTARGLTGLYVQAAFFSSFAIAAAGLLALHLRIRRDLGGANALLASLLTLAATPLAWYVIVEPSMTHAASFGVVALALVLTERWLIDRKPSRRQAIMLGCWFALVIVVRPEDGLFLLFPLAALWLAAPHRATPLIERARIAGEMAIGAMPLILAQLVMLSYLRSASSFALTGDEGYLTLFASEWMNVLFSSRHGLLSWTPAVWIALIGTAIYARRQPLWAIPSLLVFAGLVWINGSAHDWSGGWAFGGRRFTSAAAALAPGFAVALAWLRRHPLAVLVPAVTAIVGWNGLLMTQYDRQMIPRDETVRFDTLVKQQADVYLKPPYFYPFAFPANAWFAWREGLPIDRYDLLGSEPLRKELYLPLNDWSERFLLDGWSNGAGDRFGSRHFLSAQQGTIAVPLDVPSAVPFSVDVEARAEGAADRGMAALDVSVNGHSFGEIALTIGAEAPTRRAFVAPAGSKVWRRGYNRVTIARRDVPLTIPVIVYALRVGPVTQARTP